MSDHLTLVFSQPISADVQAVLNSCEWTALSHSHAIHDREVLRAKLGGGRRSGEPAPGYPDFRPELARLLEAADRYYQDGTGGEDFEAASLAAFNALAKDAHAAAMRAPSTSNAPTLPGAPDASAALRAALAILDGMEQNHGNLWQVSQTPEEIDAVCAQMRAALNHTQKAQKS